MVPSIMRQIVTLAISLGVMVISLAGMAHAAASFPAVYLEKDKPRLAPAAPDDFKGAPGRMARDADGNIYVTDFWASGIVKFDKRGNRIGFSPLPQRPIAVAVKANGDFIVSFHKPTPFVAVYNVAGTELYRLRSTAFPTGLGQFQQPTGIAIDDQNNIYVVDTANVDGMSCVQVFNSDGTAKSFTNLNPAYNFRTPTYPIAADEVRYPYNYPDNSFGAREVDRISGTERIPVPKTGMFLGPTAIYFESYNKHIVLVDSMNGRLQFFKPVYNLPYACDYVKTIGSLGYTTNQFGDPQGVGFEYDKVTGALYRIWVVDKSRNVVKAMDPAVPSELREIPDASLPAGEIFMPSDGIFDSQNKILFVSNEAASYPQDNIAVFCVDPANSASPSCLPAPGCRLTVNPPTPTACGLPSNQITITGTVEDVCTVACSVNPINPVGSTGYGGAQGDKSWSCTVTLTDGMDNVVTVTASKPAVPDTVKSQSIHYLNTCLYTLPTCTFTTPAVNPFYTNSAPTGTVQVCGEINISQNSYVVLYNRGDNNARYSVPIVPKAGSPTIGTWCADVRVNPAPNRVVAACYRDGAPAIVDPENSTTLPYTDVILDLLAPVLNEVSLVRLGVSVNYPLQNITGLVNDDNIDRVEVNGVNVRVDPKTGLFSTFVKLHRGDNPIAIQAFDLAGNQSPLNTANVITLDNAYDLLPDVKFTSPADMSIIQTIANLTGTSAATGLTVEDGPTPLTVTRVGSNWSAASTTRTPFVTFMATATEAGKSTVAKRTVIKSGSQNPEIALTTNVGASNGPSFNEDFTTNNSTVFLKGTVAPGSGRALSNCEVTLSVINQATGATTNSTLSLLQGQTCTTTLPAQQIVFSSPGVYQLRVHAIDAVDPAIFSTTMRTVYYDTAPPEARACANASNIGPIFSGAIEAGLTVQVSAKISNVTTNAGIVYSTPANTAEEQWTATFPSTIDPGTLSFQVTDKAGNVLTKSNTPVPAVPSGDIDGNGVVNILDALEALRIAANAVTPTQTQLDRADIGPSLDQLSCPNSKIDISDALLILKKATGVQSWN